MIDGIVNFFGGNAPFRERFGISPNQLSIYRRNGGFPARLSIAISKASGGVFDASAITRTCYGNSAEREKYTMKKKESGEC